MKTSIKSFVKWFFGVGKIFKKSKSKIYLYSSFYQKNVHKEFNLAYLFNGTNKLVSTNLNTFNFSNKKHKNTILEILKTIPLVLTKLSSY